MDHPVGGNLNSTPARYPNSQNLTRSRSFLLHENHKLSPCITVGLRPQLEVFESSNPLEFKVIYLGEPLPLITWKKDDMLIQNENMIKSKLNFSILYLDSVMAEDAGLYSCTVENNLGKVETRCQLTVLPKLTMSQQTAATSSASTGSYDNALCPPKVIEHLTSVKSEDGAEIELSCKIFCTSGFDVVWIHNGKEIKPSKDFQYHHNENRYMLKIPELFPEDSGIYTCEAFNDFGETFSTCSLFVTCPETGNTSRKPEPATLFKTFPKSMSVARGAPVVVQAEVDTGSGCDRQVSWLKDGVVIDQTLVNDQGKVQFSIVETGIRDTGLYEMRISLESEEHAAAFAINVL